MKTKVFAVLLALLSVSFCGCQPKYISPVDYVIAIEFVDQQGNNISQVTEKEVTLDVFYSNDKTGSLPSTFRSDVLADNVCYFIIHAGDIDCKGFRPALTWQIKSKEIFGDDKVHIIESSWVKVEKCISFSLEGNVYYPEFRNGLNTARVVINR